jgi:hypothetical protein
MLHRKSDFPFFIIIVIPHPSSSSSLPGISPSPLPSYFSGPARPSYACSFYYYFPALSNFLQFLFRPVCFFLLPSDPPRTFSTQSYPPPLSSSTCHPTAVSGYNLDNACSIPCRSMDPPLRLFPDRRGRPPIFLTSGCCGLIPHG